MTHCHVHRIKLNLLLAQMAWNHGWHIFFNSYFAVEKKAIQKLTIDQKKRKKSSLQNTRDRQNKN